MDDILGLMEATPYSERSGSGTAAQLIRVMLQKRAVAQQARSLKFQDESKQTNKQTSLPESLKQQQQMQQSAAPEPEPEMQGDIGALL